MSWFKDMDPELSQLFKCASPAKVMNRDSNLEYANIVQLSTTELRDKTITLDSNRSATINSSIEDLMDSDNVRVGLRILVYSNVMKLSMMSEYNKLIEVDEEQFRVANTDRMRRQLNGMDRGYQRCDHICNVQSNRQELSNLLADLEDTEYMGMPEEELSKVIAQVRFNFTLRNVIWFLQAKVFNLKVNMDLFTVLFSCKFFTYKEILDYILTSGEFNMGVTLSAELLFMDYGLFALHKHKTLSSTIDPQSTNDAIRRLWMSKLNSTENYQTDSMIFHRRFCSAFRIISHEDYCGEWNMRESKSSDYYH